MSRSYVNVKVYRCQFCRKPYMYNVPYLIAPDTLFSQEFCKCAFSMDIDLELSLIPITLPKIDYLDKKGRRYIRYMKRLNRRKARYYAKNELRKIKKFWNGSKTVPEHLMATNRQSARLNITSEWCL